MANRSIRDGMRPILPTEGPQMRPEVRPVIMPAGNPANMARPMTGAGQVNTGVIGSGLTPTPANMGAPAVQQASAQPLPPQVQPTANTQPINPALPTIRR
jgi:hypothetical protein